jgi:hypothetical protein
MKSNSAISLLESVFEKDFKTQKNGV